ncbi:MAG: hypothetical protein R3D89_10250 [Sphingomonadaceae bacterium]|jgi:hypothetical protein
MAGGSPEEALDRIEAALRRIEAATTRRDGASRDMAQRHDALKAEVSRSLDQLDILLGRLGQ